mmetsp:Transcript_107172/g.268640  ORF Transcript_107172/g.268640 Transcript_107172/m.268640 type:complete len:280 (-) Transcript_107172:3062-3901(-)
MARVPLRTPRMFGAQHWERPVRRRKKRESRPCFCKLHRRPRRAPRNQRSGGECPREAAAPPTQSRSACTSWHGTQREPEGTPGGREEWTGLRRHCRLTTKRRSPCANTVIGAVVARVVHPCWTTVSRGQRGSSDLGETAATGEAGVIPMLKTTGGTPTQTASKVHQTATTTSLHSGAGTRIVMTVTVITRSVAVAASTPARNTVSKSGTMAAGGTANGTAMRTKTQGGGNRGGHEVATRPTPNSKCHCSSHSTHHNSTQCSSSTGTHGASADRHVRPHD